MPEMAPWAAGRVVTTTQEGLTIYKTVAYIYCYDISRAGRSPCHARFNQQMAWDHASRSLLDRAAIAAKKCIAAKE